MQNNRDLDGDGWQIARGSGRGKSKRNGPVNPPPSVPPIDLTPPTQAQLSRYLQLIQDSKTEIRASQFYKGLLRHAFSPTASSFTEIIVYGLGSLQASGALQVRYQLALATLLLELLNSPSTSTSYNTTPPKNGRITSCKAYDPIFTPLDTAILQAHDIQILEINEHGRRIAHAKTFFFMPHCESSLTEALLQANVEAGTLHNVVILGNAFSLYVERWPRSSRDSYNGTVERPNLLLELCERGVVEEIGIPEAGFPVMSAFSSLALHTFKAHQ